MSKSNGCRAKCNVRITAGYADGSEKTTQTHNLVTDDGLDLIRDLMRGAVTDQVSYVAYGHGTTPAAAGDSAMEDEEARYVLDNDPAPAAGSLTYYHYVATADVLGSITEAGLLTKAVDGILYARTVFAEIDKTALVYLKCEWEIYWEDDGV